MPGVRPKRTDGIASGTPAFVTERISAQYCYWHYPGVGFNAYQSIATSYLNGNTNHADEGQAPMRIKELHLKNWQVIRQAEFVELSDFVVVAGPNGVGKTKIKESIVHIFQNNGNPPAGSEVILHATNEEERAAWGADEVSLPQVFWGAFFGRNNKRLKTKSRLIQIDSNRSIESVNFAQLTFQAIGNPEEEEVGANYGFDNVKNRFKDICSTLHRIKSKEVTSVYREYQANLDDSKLAVTLHRLKDPTEEYLKKFAELLYPKKMLPIDINSSTIQYQDEDGAVRNFSELSSGEREVVILTFDLIAQNPEHCLILIDEPEVHLHPELTFRLIKVLKSIGERNQFFLFTHSPDIIGNSLDTGVHFVRPKSSVKTGNQVVRVDEANIEAFASIPNIRETIGMVSVGKKLLFVEGKSSSIDRNVFATIAKSSKIDVAIIPSDSCTDVNNMTLVCDALDKGLFGVDLHMVRDRDGLTDDQISNFTTKSKGRLQFLPFYHIENAFLKPRAIEEVAKALKLAKCPSADEIESKMLDYARQQLMSTATLYVKGEIYFRAGNFDISPKITFDQKTTIADIASAMSNRRSDRIAKYNADFSQSEIANRLTYWHDLLLSSIKSGWSEEARKFFYGKRMLGELQAWLVGTKSILLWEHIVDSKEPNCIEACKELRVILAAI